MKTSLRPLSFPMRFSYSVYKDTGDIVSFNGDVQLLMNLLVTNRFKILNIYKLVFIPFDSSDLPERTYTKGVYYVAYNSFNGHTSKEDTNFILRNLFKIPFVRPGTVIRKIFISSKSKYKATLTHKDILVGWNYY